jgi:hypothetical protein
MISKRLFLPLALVLAIGLIAAGCGGDDDTDTGAATPTAAETTGGGGSGGGGGATTGGSTDAAVQQAVDACKQSVEAAPTLSASTKSDLDNLCEKAASGDVEDAQKASEQVCEEIAKDTIPSGSAQDQAVSACKAATPQ